MRATSARRRALWIAKSCGAKVTRELEKRGGWCMAVARASVRGMCKRLRACCGFNWGPCTRRTGGYMWPSLATVSFGVQGFIPAADRKRPRSPQHCAGVTAARNALWPQSLWLGVVRMRHVRFYNQAHEGAGLRACSAAQGLWIYVQERSV